MVLICKALCISWWTVKKYIALCQGHSAIFFCACQSARILGKKIQNAITKKLIELDLQGAHFESIEFGYTLC